MHFLLLLSGRKTGSSIFLRLHLLWRIHLPLFLQMVHLCRIPPISGVSVSPSLRFSGTFLSRPGQFVLHRCPSFVSSTHGVVLFFCSVLRVRFCLFPSLNTHG